MSTRMKAGGLSLTIVEHLKEFGAMTRADLELSTGGSEDRVRGALNWLKKDLPNRQRYVYVCGYVMEQEGHGMRYPRPVYAAGNRPDAKRPAPMTHAESCRKHKVKSLAMRANNFVFNLGLAA